MITRPLVGRAMLSAEATLRFGGGVRRQIPKENSWGESQRVQLSDLIFL